MAFGGQHVLGFSPSGKLFAFINDQGILRIWDTDTNELKQEYTPNLHLAGPCTALVWITVSSIANSQEKKHKKARKSSNAKESLYIALGTSKGQVSLYSYAEAKIERNLKGEGHTGKITSVIRDTQGRLITCGEDCQVVIWSIAEEKQLTCWLVGPEKPYSISYMPLSNTLVVGSRMVKVYSVESQELLQTFTGHTSEINFMESFVYEDKIEYAMTSSRMERIICLWKIGKKGRNKSASCTLLMEDIAHCLSCQLVEGKLKVSSVTRSGYIHVYVIDLESIKADKPIKPKLTINIASDSATVIKHISAIASSLQHATKPGELLFAYGGKHFMVFEQLKPNFNEKVQVLVREDPTAKNLIKQKLGHGDKSTTDAALKVLTPIIKTEDVDYKYGVGVSKKKIKSVDMPMETRLQNLNLNAPNGKVVPQSQSKVQLLVQSLHSKDAVLLRSVLLTKDMKSINLTLQKLPVQYVGTLVNELTLLMQQRHTNVAFAMNWLKVLAQTHASQLMAMGADELLDKFGDCIGVIEHRANCLKELSKLNGRLQLLVSQIKRNTQEEDGLKSDNVLVFEDNDDSSNSDLEEGITKSSLDDEWEEYEEYDDDENPENGDEYMESD